MSGEEEGEDELIRTRMHTHAHLIELEVRECAGGRLDVMARTHHSGRPLLHDLIVPAEVSVVEALLTLEVLGSWVGIAHLYRAEELKDCSVARFRISLQIESLGPIEAGSRTLSDLLGKSLDPDFGDCILRKVEDLQAERVAAGECGGGAKGESICQPVGVQPESLKIRQMREDGRDQVNGCFCILPEIILAEVEHAQLLHAARTRRVRQAAHAVAE